MVCQFSQKLTKDLSYDLTVTVLGGYLKEVKAGLKQFTLVHPTIFTVAKGGSNPSAVHQWVNG